MLFLCRRRNEITGRWWAAVEERRGEAPTIVRELLRDRQVVTSPDEAEQALQWARQQEGWTDELAPLYTYEA